MIAVETIFPGRELSVVKGWKLRASVSFATFFYLSSYLPLIWDKYLVKYQLFDLSELNIYLGLAISILVYQLLLYARHRTMHDSRFLWLLFHQMYHSAERVDVYGAYYFSPLDMIGFTMVGSLSLVVVVGLHPQIVTLFLFISTFMALFQHTNFKTPVWLGYIIQRPESHSIHHKKNVHAYNYSDLALWDMIFGTFKNSKYFSKYRGFMREHLQEL